MIASGAWKKTKLKSWSVAAPSLLGWDWVAFDYLGAAGWFCWFVP
jgi:hypothetical protein